MIVYVKTQGTRIIKEGQHLVVKKGGGYMMICRHLNEVRANGLLTICFLSSFFGCC